jgi:hypothetical protein
MSKIFKTGIFYKPYLYFNLYFKNKALKKRKTYSQHREDLFIDNYFKHKKNGFYLDIGCYHPIKYSNTALLYKKGWTGINIDLNKTTIDLFNFTRLRDKNIFACLSDREKIVDMYIDNEFSALNSIYKNNIKNHKIKKYQKIKINTKVFSNVVKEKFDFLNIDCEGNDYNILKTIDLKKYNPQIICIEVSEKNKKLIYKYLNANHYKLLTIRSLSHIFKYTKKS